MKTKLLNAMKRFCIVILCVLLMAPSCTTVKYRSFESVSFLDYSLLTDKGIFVTESNSVGFDYKAIGSIYIEIRSGANEKQKTSRSLRDKRESRDDVYSESSKSEITYTSATIEDALNKLSNQLTDVGANGIINLKISQVPATLITQNIFLGPGYIITGMAIKK